MLTGYRNLAWLKARLLPADMGDEGQYDSDLTEIGKGVAARFDRMTGRILRRTVDAVYECAADRASIVLTCYPIETLTAVELVNGDDASDILGSVTGKQAGAGILYFGGEPGASYQTIRVTSTGGFWCEDGAEEKPAGATALPDDLLQAWVEQCRAVCEAENTFRTKGAKAPDKKTAGAIDLAGLVLLPGVRQTLQLHTRLA